jgi:hypothetical protein
MSPAFRKQPSKSLIHCEEPFPREFGTVHERHCFEVDEAIGVATSGLGRKWHQACHPFHFSLSVAGVWPCDPVDRWFTKCTQIFTV